MKTTGHALPLEAVITKIVLLVLLPTALGQIAHRWLSDSTMSHLVPHYMLLEAGISDDKLAFFKFLGNHDNVALGVLTGNFDAGAVKEEVFYKYESRGLKAIATTPALSEHLFVASDALAEPLVDEIRLALLQANQSEQGLRALHAIKITISALVPAQDSDYDNLRTILATLKSHGIIQ